MVSNLTSSSPLALPAVSTPGFKEKGSHRWCSLLYLAILLTFPAQYTQSEELVGYLQLPTVNTGEVTDREQSPLSYLSLPQDEETLFFIYPDDDSTVHAAHDHTRDVQSLVVSEFSENSHVLLINTLGSLWIENDSENPTQVQWVETGEILVLDSESRQSIFPEAFQSAGLVHIAFQGTEHQATFWVIPSDALIATTEYVSNGIFKLNFGEVTLDGEGPTWPLSASYWIDGEQRCFDTRNSEPCDAQPVYGHLQEERLVLDTISISPDIQLGHW